jgi:peroxiredoxin
LADPKIVPIKQKPKGLTADARYGLGNVIINGKDVGWILDGNHTRGFVLYADWNADGNLANDAPVKFKKIGDTYLYRKTLAETVDNQKRKYPFMLKVEVAEAVPPGKPVKELVLKIYNQMTRRGTLNVDNRQTAFKLIGLRGLYDEGHGDLYFDLNGDGKFDTSRYSAEFYRTKEKYINIGDKTYEFAVERYGSSLTLKPSAEKMPDRADLSPGNIAPDFSFKDLDGNSHRLADFRRRIVLLDFWGVWCFPCRIEAPNLAAAYKRLKEKGFEIISIDVRDTPEVLRKFISEKQMNWTHLQADEALLQLYRVDQYPTYYLLDKEGKVISDTMRAGDEMYKKVEEMVENK